MKRTLAKETKTKIGESLLLKGVVHNARIMGKLAFIILKDRSGKVQVVVTDPDLVKELKALGTGSILEVEGLVKESDKTDLGVEVEASTVRVINAVTAAWPVEINKPDLKANLDTLLENRALTLRHDNQAAIFKIQGTMSQAYREYMVANDFTEFFGPAMIASSSEGGAEIFKLDYFGKKATLAQSNQLYKQIMVGVYERVFGMAKWFRAENSHTRRHLTEGTQYEFELGFIESLEDIFVYLEGAIKAMLRAVEEKHQHELEVLGSELVRLPAAEGKTKGRFPKLTFSEAIKIVAERTGEDTTAWDDLTTESERELCSYAREQYETDFLIVTNYPKGKFYAYKDESGTYHNFDLLCREAEIVSGGRRVDNYDVLVSEIEAEGMDPAAFEEYLSIFKYGMPSHGGFGLGMERFTMLALGLENIREASLFPSDPTRVASQQLADERISGADQIKKLIKQQFVEADAEFSILKHEPTPTSEDSQRVRAEAGAPTTAGVKALIMRDKKTGENFMAAIPHDQRLDRKALEARVGCKLEFEKPELILKRYGLEVGGIPPFGQVFGIPTFVDAKVFASSTDSAMSSFNVGELTESLICPTSELQKVLPGEVGEFTEAA